MIRLPDLTTSPAARRAREEIGGAWEQLVAATDQSARRVGTASRRGGKLARRRAAAAALALRGEQPSPWRWWAAGLATGVAVGVAGAVVVGRRVHDTAELRAQAQAMAGTVRQRTGTVAQNAAAGARASIHRARDRFSRGSDDAPDGDRPESAPESVPEAGPEPGLDGQPVTVRQQSQPQPAARAHPRNEPAG